MTTHRPDAKALTLVSHHLCPYVQRAAIVLAEKGVPFGQRYIDLANKPDWFRAISPLGKTPVLLVGETPVFESAVILEYLEDTQPNPLHPADALPRAEHRSWIEFGSSPSYVPPGRPRPPEDRRRPAVWRERRRRGEGRRGRA